MELDTQIVVAVALNILWNDKLSVVDTVVGIAHVCLHHQMTLVVLAACGAHHIHEYLVVGILHSEVLLCGSAPESGNMYLVMPGECETIVIILELGGYVVP